MLYEVITLSSTRMTPTCAMPVAPPPDSTRATRDGRHSREVALGGGVAVDRLATTALSDIIV